MYADSLPAEPQGKPIYLSILAISLFLRRSCKHHITGLFLLHFENLCTVVEAFGQLFYRFFFPCPLAFDLRILFTPHFSLHVLNLSCVYIYVYIYIEFMCIILVVVLENSYPCLFMKFRFLIPYHSPRLHGFVIIHFILLFLKNIYLIIWLYLVLVVANKIFNLHLYFVACRVKFPDQGLSLVPLHCEQNFSHWTIRSCH